MLCEQGSVAKHSTPVTFGAISMDSASAAIGCVTIFRAERSYSESSRLVTELDREAHLKG